MRLTTLSLVASALMIAAPAFAQTSTTNPSNQSSQQMKSQHTGAQAEAQLRQTLEKAGFKNIRIRPEAYVVHAQAADGSHVTMMISPDEVEGVVERSGTSNSPDSSQSGTGTTNKSRQ